jgi:glutamine synthetase
MAQMARREIIPAALKYCGALSAVIAGGKALTVPAAMEAETALFNGISQLVKKADALITKLEKQSANIASAGNVLKASEFCRDTVLKLMEGLREVCDALETVVAKEYWPFPTYNELLFTI